MELSTGEMVFWGAMGGFIVDGLEIYRVIRNNGGNWPEDCRTFPFFLAEVIRIASGALLALAFWKSGQVTGPVGALAVGIGTPLIVEKLSRQLPKLSGNEEEQ